jgi:hypothetical protein
MTITELSPLRSDRERALHDLLEALRGRLAEDGFGRHEHAVQTLAVATRQLTPGAAATLANRAGSPDARMSAYQVVSRVLARCGDARTHRRVRLMLGRFAYAVA